MTIESADRRTVLRGAAIIGAGAALTACGGGGGGGDSDGGGGGGDTPAAGTELGKSSEVPVGGGMIFKDAKIVVAQPTEGEFTAFSAVCTHQGCVVSSIKGDDINCACHGSIFSLKDGSVVEGPASSPLASASVTDDAGTLTLS